MGHHSYDARALPVVRNCVQDLRYVSGRIPLTPSWLKRAAVAGLGHHSGRQSIRALLLYVSARTLAPMPGECFVVMLLCVGHRTLPAHAPYSILLDFMGFYHLYVSLLRLTVYFWTSWDLDFYHHHHHHHHFLYYFAR